MLNQLNLNVRINKLTYERHHLPNTPLAWGKACWAAKEESGVWELFKFLCHSSLPLLIYTTHLLQRTSWEEPRSLAVVSGVVRPTASPAAQKLPGPRADSQICTSTWWGHCYGFAIENGFVEFGGELWFLSSGKEECMSYADGGDFALHYFFTSFHWFGWVCRPSHLAAVNYLFCCLR